jgi:hypothetical protein
MRGVEIIFLFLTVFLVGFSFIGVVISYVTLSRFDEVITGHPTRGIVNLTIGGSAELNFTKASVDWGGGIVNGTGAAALTTLRINNVTGGNWTLQTAGGHQIENIGNFNLSVNISAAQNGADMIGGTGADLRWNFSTHDEPNSCLNSTGQPGATTPSRGFPLILNIWHGVNTSSIVFCEVFQYVSDADIIRIDYNATVPDDALPGLKNNTITVSFVAT